MDTSMVEKIANAVLYEGYLLYPYRASAVKNQHRFNFGVVYPPAYGELQAGNEASQMTTECLLLGTPSTIIEGKVRFLQLAAHGDRQEGEERDISTPICTLRAIAAQPLLEAFTFAGTKTDGRRSETLEGELELGATQLGANLFRIALHIRNLAVLENARDLSRDEVLLRSFISAHTILKGAGGEFVSSLDPPEDLEAAVAGCHNSGTWPVLVGPQGQRDCILSAPIILYDYPQIAPESPGDLFDGTEIDEILALRILTMTDAEKLEVRSGDDRARKILERTEMLPPEHFQKLHGALRSLRPRPEESR